MRHRRHHSGKIKAEVNLTPLIDIMTSLLAIFMITAPLLTSGIPLNLPKGDGKTIDSNEKTLDIGINEKGQIFVAEQQVNMDNLIKKVTAIVSENPKIQMMISGDQKANYGTVIEVMAALRQAGFTQVGLKTDAQTVLNKGK
ncbi:MAG: biopolymer transporter ExbD [Alphaproteobacteria bacterium]|nr:biopolymer transporter ExbD [Alphaproteobacteria bacterium]